MDIIELKRIKKQQKKRFVWKIVAWTLIGIVLVVGIIIAILAGFGIINFTVNYFTD